jgi:tartrate dehydratase beta subunit/fumarate hydratase class I family protein
METKKRNLVMALVVVGVAAAAFVFLNQQGDTGPQDIQGAIYYRGPMKAKGGDSWGTLDGRKVERPTETVGKPAGVASAPGKPDKDKTQQPQ